MIRRWRTVLACTTLTLALVGCGDDVGGTEEPDTPGTPRPAQEGDYRNDPGVGFFDVTHADGQTYRCLLHLRRTHRRVVAGGEHRRSCPVVREEATPMSDRIDTDANPSDLRAWLTFHDLDPTEARRMALALLDDRETLRAEVDALRSREVPDGHVRIDGKVYRVAWVNGHSLDYTPAKLVPVEEP